MGTEPVASALEGCGQAVPHSGCIAGLSDERCVVRVGESGHHALLADRGAEVGDSGKAAQDLLFRQPQVPLILLGSPEKNNTIIGQQLYFE